MGENLARPVRGEVAGVSLSLLKASSGTFSVVMLTLGHNESRNLVLSCFDGSIDLKFILNLISSSINKG